MVWHGAEAGGLIDFNARTVLRQNPAGYKHKRQCHQHVRSHDCSLAVLCSETTVRAEDRAFWESADVNLYFLVVSNRVSSASRLRDECDSHVKASFFRRILRVAASEPRPAWLTCSRGARASVGALPRSKEFLISTADTCSAAPVQRGLPSPIGRTTFRSSGVPPFERTLRKGHPQAICWQFLRQKPKGKSLQGNVALRDCRLQGQWTSVLPRRSRSP